MQIEESELAFARQFAGQPHRMLIGGAWQDAASGRTIDVVDPASGQVVGAVPAGGADAIDQAVVAAAAALPAWAAKRGGDRAKMLWALADKLVANARQLGALESLDNGMVFRMGMFGVMGAAEGLRYNAGWADKISGETVNVSAPDNQAIVVREPVGVVGLIVPWNFPLAMAVAKIGPALAAGCTVVLKPAELTSLSALRLGELIVEAGFPAGVVNIVTGYGADAGQALVEHGRVDKVAFTGSTATGKRILAAAAGNLKRVSLELGGKSPVVIFPDADIAAAGESAAMGVFMNSGQICVAGSRVFIHRSVFDQTVEVIAARARMLRLGRGSASDTDLGPLISATQRDRVLGFVEAGVREGGEVLTGGKAGEGDGFFVEPTVFVNVGKQDTVMREEIFGPVVAAVPFDDFDEVIDKANDTEYGLSASVWTSNVATALRAARAIHAGTVRVNGGTGLDPAMPFGGFKQSGWGRENGRQGVEAFTELKSIAIKF